MRTPNRNTVHTRWILAGLIVVGLISFFVGQSALNSQLRTESDLIFVAIVGGLLFDRWIAKRF